MTNIVIQRGGTMIGATSYSDVLRALAQQQARSVTAPITDLINSSGGTAVAGIFAHATAANAAAVGSSLAPKTETEVNLNLVLDGLAELIAKANTVATALGFTNITDNSGATAPDGTIGAFDVSITAGATGVQASNINTTCDALDNMQYQAWRLINQCANAVGVTALTCDYTEGLSNTIASLTVGGGTNADPGVTKVAMDAILARYQANVKTLATTLIAITTAAVPYVVAV